MALDQITDAKLPFGMGSIDLLSMSGLYALLALILGATVWSLADAMGGTLASRVASTIGNVVGVNPATGENNDSGPAFGGF